MKDKKVIFVVARPAAGKGTQIEYLEEKTGFFRFITSKEGKEYIRTHRNDPKTLEQEKAYKEGSLFDPEWLLRQVQKERAEEILKGDYSGIIFDGSPRTLYEAKHLLEITDNLVSKKNIIVIEIDVSEKEVKKRTAERLVCDKEENHTVSTRFGDFKIGDNCTKCDGRLIKRDLDKKLDERLEQYQKRTVPGIEYLKNHYNVVVINGEQSIEDVRKDINEKLDPWLK